ncbi:MAG TPA: SUMF1/EgtB/PvdO family nonheme iron enzyme [Vicinamibacterales bacterium]|nr:SUMF1/EgtB/PvdO family nonheme iron enzyme [Vicinamibacterales bacterium]
MPFDRAAALSWYARNRERSRALFDMLPEDVYYTRPIDLRHPVVFYDGHLPGFSFNTLVKRALGRPSIDARLESLFARGIDPHESNGSGAPDAWPSRDVVRAFVKEADARVVEVLTHDDLDRPGDPLLSHADAVFTILEHEAMHQETLLYMWHRLPFSQKIRPADYAPQTEAAVPPDEWCDVPGGSATLGADRDALPFGWDNELPSCTAEVATFQIQRHNVTNARFMEFVDAGGYRDSRWWSADDWRWVQSQKLSHPLFWEHQDGSWYWRGMFELIPLPVAWPVYVSQAEASAYARWHGCRLATEAEYQRSAVGAAPGLCDFESWDPEPAGARARVASEYGVEDLVGNGWEWTSSRFGPFPGFRASASYPEYSADFFDGEHFVMKGASPATARELLRPTFRNWFRARYPYVYATFRCVRPEPSERIR